MAALAIVLMSVLAAPLGATAISTAHGVTVAPSPSPRLCARRRLRDRGRRLQLRRAAATPRTPRSSTPGARTTRSRTGNALGNNIAALVSSSPDSGFGPYTGGVSARRPCPTLAMGATRTRRHRPESSSTTGIGSCSTTRPRPVTAATPGTTAWPWPRRPPFPRGTCSSMTSRMLRSSASRPARSTPSPLSTRARAWRISSGSRTTAGRARRPTSGRSS